MNWYHVLQCDNTVENPLVCDYDNLDKYGLNYDCFQNGKEIDNWDNNIYLQAKDKKNDGDPDDVLQNHLMLLIFSERLINELKKEKISGIQYLPVTILRPNKTKINGFSIVNILNFVEALNYEKSQYKRVRNNFPNPHVRGQIAGITKYVLYKNKLLDLYIIRLKDFRYVCFVSEKVKEIFEKNKFTGFSFEEIELSD